MVLQVLHDGALPEQDHLHAIRASLLAPGEDCGLCQGVLAGGVGGDGDPIAG